MSTQIGIAGLLQQGPEDGEVPQRVTLKIPFSLTYTDYRALAEDFWERFSGWRDATVWFYRALASVLGQARAGFQPRSLTASSRNWSTSPTARGLLDPLYMHAVPRPRAQATVPAPPHTRLASEPFQGDQHCPGEASNRARLGQLVQLARLLRPR